MVDINMTVVASDNENATIQNIQSVAFSLRKLSILSVPVWVKNNHHNYNFLTNASKLRYQFESYSLKCHCFTMFTITQTFSGKSVTLMVNAVFTARILTIFSIGVGTFWKMILMVIVNSRFPVHVAENQIASKLWNI